MKKHLFLLALSSVLVISGLAISEEVLADKHESDSETLKNKNESALQRDPLEIEVTLQKQYLDGRVEENHHTETIWSMQDFWSYYQDWQLVEQHQGEIVFKKEIPDISPYLKEKGYFGLRNDILTIFEGKPEDAQVIESFYHIDTSELESNQAQQLEAGIKIDSKEIYQYVIESFKQLEPLLNS